MKIVVTGGMGYIGSVLCEMLLSKGWEVTCVDNLFFQQLPNASLFSNDKFRFVKLDVRDTSQMEGLLKDKDAFIPLAALVGAPICQMFPSLARQTNVEAITDLLTTASRNLKLLMPITNSGYGIGQLGKDCDEESPLNPISQYGRDKVELEAELKSKWENFVSFRLATVFGVSPRMRRDLLVNDFVWKAVKDGYLVLFEGHFVRNYIHVRDVCRAFIFALENWKEFKGEIFNVGLSDANLTKIELAGKIKEQLPDLAILLEEMKKDPDQRNYIVSNSKIERTGYSPTFTIERGISELISYYTALPRETFSNV